MTEPITQTGKRFARRYVGSGHADPDAPTLAYLADILAIEREAAAAERERIRAVDPFGAGWDAPYPIPKHLTVTVRGGTPLDLLLDFQAWLLADPEVPNDE